MSILENNESWAKKFRDGWLTKLQKTGTFYWNAYIFPNNQIPVAGKGIDLKSSRLMLISSAGGYVTDSQQPFDASNPLGDYTVRKFPSSIAFEDLSYAHEHYDHTAVNADPQVLLPLRHLHEMVKEGKIGELTSVISFMGYQPDISRLLDETIPAILGFAREEQVDAALFVPS